jgi:hypothetical protein
MLCENRLKIGTGRGQLPEVASGTLSETRYAEEYLCHWQVDDNVLMVKLGFILERSH